MDVAGIVGVGAYFVLVGVLGIGYTVHRHHKVKRDTER
jgi:hypothetical protein